MKRSMRSVYYRLVRPHSNVSKLDFRKSYGEFVKFLKEEHDDKSAMEIAVGGDFEGVGTLELETLKYFGLQKDSFLIDVGCGSGRLAKPLSEFSTGRYLGIDVVPELLEHARRTVNRPSWKFIEAEGLTIPAKDGEADMVCFFSVFTHLLHEQSYSYLLEAKRVLKPGGKTVFSFLDFTMEDHWPIFETNVKNADGNVHPLNIFISKDAISVWAKHLELEIEAVADSNERFIPLSRKLHFDGGGSMEDLGFFGQSLAVLTKPA